MVDMVKGKQNNLIRQSMTGKPAFPSDWAGLLCRSLFAFVVLLREKIRTSIRYCKQLSSCVFGTYFSMLSYRTRKPFVQSDCQSTGILLLFTKKNLHNARDGIERQLPNAKTGAGNKYDLCFVTNQIMDN
jgi:hypothetical protein